MPKILKLTRCAGFLIWKKEFCMFDVDSSPAQRQNEVWTFFSSDMCSVKLQTHSSQGEFDLAFLNLFLLSK